MLDTIFIIAAIGTAAALCFFGLFYRLAGVLLDTDNVPAGSLRHLL